MSDEETPASDESPDASATDDTPPPEAEDTDATLPETAAATPAAASAATEERAGVFVPRWVAFLVGGLVAVLLVGGVGFALGRATDDDHDDRGAVVFGPGGPFSGGGQGGDSRNRPFPLPNPGGGGGNGSGPAVPGVPSIPRGGVLLGVAVESSNGDTAGARVAQVVPGSPAQDAGFEVGDVITKVDDTDIPDAQHLVAEIRSHEAGDEVSITYERNGESHVADVTLGGESSSSANGSGSERSSTS